MNLKRIKMTFSHQQFLKHYIHKGKILTSPTVLSFKIISFEAKMTLERQGKKCEFKK